LHQIDEADRQLRSLDSRIAAQNEKLRLTRELHDKARIEDEAEGIKIIATIQIKNAVVPAEPIAPDQPMFLTGGILVGLVSAYGVLASVAFARRKSLLADHSAMLLGLTVNQPIPIALKDMSLR